MRLDRASRPRQPIALVARAPLVLMAGAWKFARLPLEGFLRAVFKLANALPSRAEPAKPKKAKQERKGER